MGCTLRNRRQRAVLSVTDSRSKPRHRSNSYAAPHCRWLINIAHIPGELPAGSANELRPNLDAGLQPWIFDRDLRCNFGKRGCQIKGCRDFETEQYCSAKHPDTDQYADSQGDLSRLEPK
jgi:hypothetical protein